MKQFHGILVKHIVAVEKMLIILRQKLSEKAKISIEQTLKVSIQETVYFYSTVYQYGKNVLYFFYNIAQRTLTEEWREIFRVDIELYQHGS